MISNRAANLFILFFWASSMTWLGWTKLRPASRGGEPPQHGDVLPSEAGKFAPIHWKITLNGQPLGWAEHRVERYQDGQGQVQSVVRLEHLPLNEIVHQGFGGIGSILARGLRQATDDITSAGALRLTVNNSMQFDHFGELLGFECVVTEDRWGECIRMQGTVREDELFLRAYISVADDSAAGAGSEPVLQKQFPLPPEKIVVDSLSPRPRFGRLRLGQTWTFDSYNPLSPARPLQTLEARVEEATTIQHAGREVSVWRVVYRRANDRGLSMEQDVGDLFVTMEGEVLRQSLQWGRLNLSFERVDNVPAQDDATADTLSAEGRGE